MCIEIFQLLHLLQILMELHPTGSRPKETISNNHSISNEHSDVVARNKTSNQTEQSQNGQVAPAKRQKTSSGVKNVIIINVSPIDYCHILLVPDIEGCLPQVCISL